MIGSPVRYWKSCPCADCQYSPKPPRTQQRHCEQIASGRRLRAPPPSLVAEEPEEKVEDNEQGLQESDSESEEDGLEVDIKVAKELRDVVARGLATQQGMEAISKIYFGNYAHHLPEGIQMPSSWYRVRTLAGSDQASPLFYTRDFCPSCDTLYPEDRAVLECPSQVCKKTDRFNNKGKPVRLAFYFDLEERLQRIFAQKYVAREMRYSSTREVEDVPLSQRELRDVWDGTILHDMQNILDEDTIVLQQSNDGVEVQKNVSYTPVVFKYLNLPPSIRSRFGTMLLLAFFPPRIKNHQAMFRPLVEQLARYQPGRETVSVYDAFQEQVRQLSVVVAPLINDIRGLPHTTMGKAPPAYVGSCNYCMQGGFWHRRVTLPGVCRALPMNSPVRELFQEEFGHVQGMDELSRKGRPQKRTREGAIRAGKLVESGQRSASDEAYKGVDVYTLLLDYHDKVQHTLYDLAHNFCNVIKQALNTIKNTGKDGKSLFNRAMRKYENDMGRFGDWYTIPQVATYTRYCEPSIAIVLR